jgi:Coenzyme PQQ synthesis protein D (PqqD)
VADRRRPDGSPPASAPDRDRADWRPQAKTGPCFRRAPGILSREFLGRALVTTPDQREVYQLDGSAGAVWMLLDEARSVPELVELLSEEYQASPEIILPQVQALLDDLAARRVLEEFVFDG